MTRSRKLVWLATTFLAALLSGCQSGDAANQRTPEGDPGLILEDDRHVGGGYAQCEGHKAAYGETNAAIDLTLSTFIGAGQTVRCVNSKTFTVDNQPVTLTFASYGELQDCPAGCFSSFVCAIVEDNHALAYAHDDYDTDCSASDCENELPGQNHKITQNKAFKQFIDEQLAEYGPYRYCF